jgi:hypothetical protein
MHGLSSAPDVFTPELENGMRLVESRMFNEHVHGAIFIESLCIEKRTEAVVESPDLLDRKRSRHCISTFAYRELWLESGTQSFGQ